MVRTNTFIKMFLKPFGKGEKKCLPVTGRLPTFLKTNLNVPPTDSDPVSCSFVCSGDRITTSLSPLQDSFSVTYWKLVMRPSLGSRLPDSLCLLLVHPGTSPSPSTPLCLWLMMALAGSVSVHLRTVNRCFWLAHRLYLLKKQVLLWWFSYSRTLS